MSSIALSFLLFCTPAALLDYVIPRWKADPNTRIEDAYKWTYQATRGGEHAAPSRDAAGKWLDDEWGSMGDEPQNENEWIALCPGGEIGRLNLRPFKARGGKTDDILDAFLNSSRTYRPEPKAFTDAWGELGARLKKQGFGSVTHKDWQRLDGEMKKKDYPAIHHSEQYKKTYKPAYRIITLNEAQRIIPN
ncbi:MAG: hypothetical protein ABL959_10985 [Pyrinomonadaceae bacterium]